MTAFASEADLRSALWNAGLAQWADRVEATARPALLFARRQQPDDPLPPGTSKIGGLPDLPAGAEWPHRAPLADAQARADWELENRAQVRSFARQLLDPAPAREADEDRRDAIMIAAFSQRFPYSFKAQLDLGALSALPGFDADLPRHGLLSIFEDLTSDGGDGWLRVLWHDVPAETLVRHRPPEAVIALSDAEDGGFPWADQTMAETLHPASALSVPHHWRDAAGVPAEAMFAFLRGSFGQFSVGESEGEINFGDRLGGWPDPIQGNPECGLEGDPYRAIEPGDDRMRHVFTFGGEWSAGTRLMHSRITGDGYSYVMIERDTLLARRFGEAWGLYQCD